MEQIFIPHHPYPLIWYIFISRATVIKTLQETAALHQTHGIMLQWWWYNLFNIVPVLIHSNSETTSWSQTGRHNITRYHLHPAHRE